MALPEWLGLTLSWFRSAKIRTNRKRNGPYYVGPFLATDEIRPTGREFALGRAVDGKGRAVLRIAPWGVYGQSTRVFFRAAGETSYAEVDAANLPPHVTEFLTPFFEHIKGATRHE